MASWPCNEAYPRWQELHAAQAKTVLENGVLAALPHLPAYDKGPVAEVNLLACLRPFVFKAECVQAVGGLEGHEWTGWYLTNPWRTYGFWGEPNWIS